MTTPECALESTEVQNALPTPGKWFVLKQGTTCGIKDIGLHDIGAYLPIGDNGALVCIAHLAAGKKPILHGAYTITPAESYANACIMAAAKDMQNALLKLRDAIEEGDPHAIAEALIRYGIPAIEKSQGGGDD